MQREVQTSLFESSQPLTTAQYLLAINPSSNISIDVANMKRPLKRALGKGFGLTSKAHLSLLGFPLAKKREELLIRQLDEISRELTPLLLQLDGFGTFSTSGTIYLNPTPNEGLTILYQKMARALRMTMRVPAKYVGKSFSPHITIARNLNNAPLLYQKLWSLFKDKEYDKHFTVDRLVLLRYKDDDSGKTELVSEFKLGNIY